MQGACFVASGEYVSRYQGQQQHVIFERWESYAAFITADYCLFRGCEELVDWLLFLLLLLLLLPWMVS
jgi:hypothetical protein